MFENSGCTQAKARLLLDSLLPVHHLEGALADITRVYRGFHEQGIVLPKIEFKRPSICDRHCGFFSTHEQNGCVVNCAVELVTNEGAEGWKTSAELQRTMGDVSGRLYIFHDPTIGFWQKVIQNSGRIDSWVTRHGGTGEKGVCRIRIFDIELEATVRLMAQEILSAGS